MSHQHKDPSKTKGPAKITPLPKETTPPPSFTLDDILSEFGGEHTWEEARQPTTGEGKVVPFPGHGPRGEKASPEGEKAEDMAQEGPLLSGFLKDLAKRADHYADQMFQQEELDMDEIRRLEELIPGTDEETSPPEMGERPPRRKEPPPPDLPPQELVRIYSIKLQGMVLRLWSLLMLVLLSLGQLLLPGLDQNWIPLLGQYQVQLWLCCLFLSLGILLCSDLLWDGLVRGVRGKVGMDTLAGLAALFTLGDGLVLILGRQREGQLPYSCVVLVGLWILLWGRYQRLSGLRLTCRTAAAAAEPYLITLDEGRWNGRCTYAKWSGIPHGFGSQIQMDDGAQRIFYLVCPLLLLACLLLSLIASGGMGRWEHLLWALSATFTASTALGAPLCYNRPMYKLAQRLAQSGAALAGWPGVAQSGRGDRILLTDQDLFPPGFVEMNGIKIFGEYSVERVVGYTATLLRDAGSGLTKLFHDLLRAQGGVMRRTEQMALHEGGGISAMIRGDQVLVGSAPFMQLMDVALPQGLHIKNAVFCAIDGTLAGIFALNYRLPDTVFPGIETLLRAHIGPVLATRDFNLIPSMLHQRFKLAADKMDFPPVMRRQELSDPDQTHSEILTAVLCREGLMPYAEAVVGAKQLRRATRVGALLSCTGSLIGLLLAYYLTSVEAYGSLSPLNLLIFLLFWLAPIAFLTSWVPRY